LIAELLLCNSSPIQNLTCEEIPLSTILEKIVATKRLEIEKAKSICSLASLKTQLPSAPPLRDFHAVLAGYEKIRLIAEVKKASPSKGIIREDFNPVAIAQAYQAGGAAALSVLTDRDYFQGDLAYLTQIRSEVDLPLLRKDFILDEYQIVEARVAGADAVLLIAECLSAVEMMHLYRIARDLGMHALIELYERDNLEAVLGTGCPLVGVNNRDLHTFEVDLHHTIRMKESIPSDRCVVGESGIFTAADAKLLHDAGVQAILVGESLMRQPDITQAVHSLLGNA
jgi:indole-3-glycerol phosphate synthase